MTDATEAAPRAKRRALVSLPVLGAIGVIAILAVGLGVWLTFGRTSGKVEDPGLTTAESKYDSGDFTGAEAELNEILASDPGNVDALRQLALALSAQGKNEEAVEKYAAIVDANPKDDQALYAMAGLEQLIGRADDSIKHYEAAIAVNRDATYLQALAPVYATVGQWAQCIDTWEKYLEVGDLNEGQQAQVHVAIASAYEGMRDYESAKKELEAALFLDPNNEAYKARLEAYGE